MRILRIEIIKTSDLFWHSSFLHQHFDVEENPNKEHYLVLDTPHNRRILNGRFIMALVDKQLWVSFSRSREVDYRTNQDALRLLSKEE